MLHFVHGDIFKSPAEILVNPVNCVGIMGKGLALQFKKRYPGEFNLYKVMCQNKEIYPGDCVMLTDEDSYNKKIMAVATKNHWRNPSKLEYIKLALRNIQGTAIALSDRFPSIAIPKLGCGCGGLDWKTQVRPLISLYLDVPEIKIDIYVYE